MLPILCRHLHAWITLYFDSKFLKSLKEVRSGPTYWSGGGFELEDLMDQTNRFHETIKFTTKYGDFERGSTNFLDVWKKKLHLA